MGALDGNQTNGKGSSFDAGGISTLGPVNGLTLEAGNGQANQVVLEGATAGNPPQIVAQGSDASIDLALVAKGGGGVRLGAASSNPIYDTYVESLAITPASVPANSSEEQIFPDNGTAAVGDVLIGNWQGALTAGISIGNIRVSSAGHIGVTFVNSTAAAIVPAAGTLKILGFTV